MLKRSSRTRPAKIGCLSILVFFCLISSAEAMDVTLGWDANTESDRAGYRIYYDTDSGPPYEGMDAAEGDSPIDVSIGEVENGDSAQYTLTGLDGDGTYYFVLTAYNTSGRESNFSVEVSTADDASSANTNSAKGGGGCFITTILFCSPLR